MDFCFVYSSGGGAGDWNAIDRIWQDSMPQYFRNNLLIKFGDIFFNHRSSNNLIKPSYWNNTDNARQWLFNNTNDNSLFETDGLVLDVGTSKIVSFITHHNENMNGVEIIQEFDRLINDEQILDKFNQIIVNSNISNAVTFDIPNLFKVRTQVGNQSRNLFSENGCRQLLIEASAKYANYTYNGIGQNPNLLLTIISAHWSDEDIEQYLNLLNYNPTKLAIGGLTDYRVAEFSEMLVRLNNLLNFSNYERVHFLGSGGIRKANIITETLGNLENFSVDNTTAYNRAIDGNKRGTSMSGYYDYVSKDLIRINPQNRSRILQLHSEVPNNRAYFSNEEMTDIIDSILLHQSNNTSHNTFNNRAKLVIHNFDVYRYNIE
ncbi:hypothetical protein [Kordia zhangzhouensis]|uniref:hypothetical protein n=1 Tax=Kordia zhangzhouensis TaxID=1620405 RepID=UPI0006299CEE|nr:hypothetical protein [Kordia zhangzhouensis]